VKTATASPTGTMRTRIRISVCSRLFAIELKATQAEYRTRHFCVGPAESLAPSLTMLSPMARPKRALVTR
jgi:hypothetical protein